MDQSVSPDWGSSVTASPGDISVLTNTTIFTWTADETNAGWFIIVVIGFFAFIITSSLVVNQLHAEPPEEDILTDLFNKEKNQTKTKRSVKLENPLGFMNQAYSETVTGNQDNKHYKGLVNHTKKIQRDDDKTPSASTSAPDPASETVICITTVS